MRRESIETTKQKLHGLLDVDIFKIVEWKDHGKM